MNRLGFRSGCALSVAVLSYVSLSPVAVAGPYSTFSDDGGNMFDAPVSSSDARIGGWATGVVSYSLAPGVVTGNDISGNALGVADGSTVSLGDLWEVGVNEPSTTDPTPFGPADPWNGNANDLTDDFGFVGIDGVGQITVSFDSVMERIAGADFAVYENGFSGSFGVNPAYVFGEFAHVEVSSDGVNFARFSSVFDVLETELDTLFGRDFAALDPTDVYNLAGKHVANWGTPFDLDELVADPLVIGGDVDLDAILYVRLVDVPGNGGDVAGDGNGIFDSWVSVGSGGFDLDGVALLQQVPEPGSVLYVVAGGCCMVWRGRGGSRINKKA